MRAQGAEDGEPVFLLRVDQDDPDLEMDEDQAFWYRGELFDGVMTRSYLDGTLVDEVHYRGGKPEGRGRSWYGDGTPKSEYLVQARQVVGVAKGWHRNGVLSDERRFHKGLLVEVREWDEEGNFIVKPPTTRGFNLPEEPDRAGLREQSLADRVEHDRPLPAPLYHVAAVNLRYIDSDTLRAVAVVFDAESLERVETAKVDHVLRDARAFARRFEETLACVEALRPLTTPVGLIVCPGNGPNHPVALNLATHLGVVTGTASFGVSDAAYAGAYQEPGEARGAWSELVEDGVVIGRVVRTQAGQEPVFVTYGQRVDLEGAVEMALRLSRDSRMPVEGSAAESSGTEDRV